MEAFFARLVHEIGLKSVNSGNIHGCRLWHGCVTQNGYGRKKVSFPDGSKTIMLVHRVVYMCAHGTLDIPNIGEMSHLCHNKLCVNADHIVCESHEINMERYHCVQQGSCTGAHQPACLLE